MESLNADIIGVIFDTLCMTGKRGFIRTCKTYYHRFEKTIKPHEISNLQTMIRDEFIIGPHLLSKLSKYTLEILFDECANLLPVHYFKSYNHALFQEHGEIYYNVAKKGNIDCINILMQCKKVFFSRIMDGLAMHGNLDKLKMFIDRCPIDKTISAHAAAAGHLHIIKWLKKNNYPWDHNIYAGAAKCGNLDIIKWACKHYVPWDDRTFQIAAKYGHLSILKYLRVHEYAWDTLTFENAVLSCNLKILQWIYDNGCPWDSYTMNAAIDSNNMNILKWVIDNGCPRGRASCRGAAINGNLEMLQWLTYQGFPWTDDMAQFIFTHPELAQWVVDIVFIPETMTDPIYHELDLIKYFYKKDKFSLGLSISKFAAMHGNLDIIRWFYHHGYDYSDKAEICSNAAGSHLHILQWARDNGFVWDAQSCKSAVEGDNLEMLKWLRSHDCPWDETTCAAAAITDNLEMLKWLRSHGCPWNGTTCSVAAGCGNINIIKWARANGCPWNEYICTNAADNGYLEIIQWARAQGCPWDKYTSFSAVTDLKTLQWVLENGCPYHEDTLEQSKYFGCCETYEWLIECYLKK